MRFANSLCRFATTATKASLRNKASQSFAITKIKFGNGRRKINFRNNSSNVAKRCLSMIKRYSDDCVNGLIKKKSQS